MIGSLVFGFVLGLCVATIVVNRLVMRLCGLVAYWRSEQVKAKRAAFEAQKRWLDDRNDYIRDSDWWRKE